MTGFDRGQRTPWELKGYGTFFGELWLVMTVGGELKVSGPNGGSLSKLITKAYRWRSAFRLAGHRPDYRSFISSFRVVREASGRDNDSRLHKMKRGRE